MKAELFFDKNRRPCFYKKSAEKAIGLRII